MKLFRKFAFFSILATYLLIFVGGLVRVSGAGLGCPDWPKCFGSWMPPISVHDLPAGFDPAKFNFVLAWIEYVNRLLGVLVGLLIATTAILAIFYMRRYKGILTASIIAAFAVAFQGWYGSQVVASKLASHTISIHMLLALIIVGLLIWVAQKSFYLENPPKTSGVKYPSFVMNTLILLWPLSVIQIVMGTELRSHIEQMLEMHPLLFGQQIIDRLGWVHNLHTLLGVVLGVLTIMAALIIFKTSNKENLLIRQSSLLLTGVIICQVLIGFLTIAYDIPALGQVFHLWGSSLFVGIFLILFTAVRQNGKNHG